LESSIPSRSLIPHIYIHIPFCSTKCGYCSFYSIPYHSERVRVFLHTLLKEIALYQQSYDLVPKTVYFGGGTPSLLKPAVVEKILSHFGLSACEEITLEMNPITVTDKYLQELSKTKVNRISLGTQSFVEKELKFLERRHSPSQIIEKVNMLRQYRYHNISLDLMYGLPGQTIADVKVSLESLLQLSPEHISTYCLGIEEKTAFHDKGVAALDDDLVADIYLFIRNTLVENGYIHYEISNFAKAGYESKHNLAYWDGMEYLGLGAGASGFLGSIRYHNAEDLDHYMHDVNEQLLYPNGNEESPIEIEKEYIFMNLRKASGLKFSDYHERFGKDFIQQYNDVIMKYKKMNLLTIHADSIALNPGAYFISNEILHDFM
jgi:putative oxygen-independent coproporphyrinogen III oxidase